MKQITENSKSVIFHTISEASAHSEPDLEADLRQEAARRGHAPSGVDIGRKSAPGQRRRASAAMDGDMEERQSVRGV